MGDSGNTYPQHPLHLTQEQIDKIELVRVLVGDMEGSLFYPALTDEQYAKLLKSENWNVRRAVRRVATTIAFQLSTWNTRERTADIEVWNEASTAYREVLELLIKGANDAYDLPDLLHVYAAGISIKDYCTSINNPDKKRSPLAQISPCISWWEQVKRNSCNRKGGCR